MKSRMVKRERERDPLGRFGTLIGATRRIFEDSIADPRAFHTRPFIIYVLIYYNRSSAPFDPSLPPFPHLESAKLATEQRHSEGRVVPIHPPMA